MEGYDQKVIKGAFLFLPNVEPQIKLRERKKTKPCIFPLVFFAVCCQV